MSNVPQDVIAFLLGEGELDGVPFGEVPEGKPKFWWREALRQLRAQRSNTEPVAYRVTRVHSEGPGALCDDPVLLAEARELGCKIEPLYPPSAIQAAVREKLDENLIQRCKEVRSWQKTGVLKENSKLKEYADKYYSGLENNLLNAEADTGAQAMQLLIDLYAP